MLGRTDFAASRALFTASTIFSMGVLNIDRWIVFGNRKMYACFHVGRLSNKVTTANFVW